MRGGGEKKLVAIVNSEMFKCFRYYQSEAQRMGDCPPQEVDGGAAPNEGEDAV